MKTKIKKYMSWPRLIALLALVTLVVISTTRPLTAQQVTQGYGTDEPMERGMLVRLKDGDTSKVSLLKQAEAKYMHGVVVAPNDAPITLSSDDQKVFVASSGHYDVLVSTQNGEIKQGDYITISAVDGIGMKANKDSTHVIGKALNSFNNTSSVEGNTQVNGKTTKYGRVITDLTVAANPLFNSSGPAVPGFLQKAAQSVGGKSVSTARTYVATFVAMATLLVTGVLLYGSIRSSIIAVGRNPLSRSPVGRGLLKVLLVSLIIFLSGIFAVYLLLKL